MYKNYKSDKVVNVVHAKGAANSLMAKLKKSKASKSQSACESSWRDILILMADMDLWEGRRREERQPWKGYLQKTQELLKTPRQPLPQVGSISLSYLYH